MDKLKKFLVINILLDLKIKDWELDLVYKVKI